MFHYLPQTNSEEVRLKMLLLSSGFGWRQTARMLDLNPLLSNPLLSIHTGSQLSSQLQRRCVVFKYLQKEIKTTFFNYYNPKLTLSLRKVLSSKLRKKSWISFCTIVKSKQHHLKVLFNSFHLNGHTLGFNPQLTQGLTLGVKGLNIIILKSSYTNQWEAWYPNS